MNVNLLNASLNRDLGLTLLFDSMVEDVPVEWFELQSSTFVLRGEFGKNLEKLTEFVGQSKGNVLIDGEVEFKELFAHGKCAFMLDAIAHQLDGNFVKAYVLLDCFGAPVHFVGVVQFGEVEFYVDAYGLYQGRELIESRYVGTNVSMWVEFDIYNESGDYYEIYRDCATDAITMVSELSDDVDESSDYCEYFELTHVNNFMKYLMKI